MRIDSRPFEHRSPWATDFQDLVAFVRTRLLDPERFIPETLPSGFASFTVEFVPAASANRASPRDR